jgi:hypothetical protein
MLRNKQSYMALPISYMQKTNNHETATDEEVNSDVRNEGTGSGLVSRRTLSHFLVRNGEPALFSTSSATLGQ